jgi:ankyrin repeat protein
MNIISIGNSTLLNQSTTYVCNNILTKLVLKRILKVSFAIFAILKIRDWTFTWAVKKGYEKLAKAMILLSADVNRKDWGNLSPLHIAAEKGNAKMLEILLKAKANLNIEGGHCIKRGRLRISPLNCALRGGDIKCVKKMIDEAGHKITNSDVLVAISAGHKDLVEFLIDEYKLDLTYSNV